MIPADILIAAAGLWVAAALANPVSRPGVETRAPSDEYRSPGYYPAPYGGWAGDWAESYARARKLVKAMTLAEKTNITGGTGIFMGAFSPFPGRITDQMASIPLVSTMWLSYLPVFRPLIASMAHQASRRTPPLTSGLLRVSVFLRRLHGWVLGLTRQFLSHAPPFHRLLHVSKLHVASVCKLTTAPADATETRDPSLASASRNCA